MSAFDFDETLISSGLDCSRAVFGFLDSGFGGSLASAMTDDFGDLDDFDMICLSMCNGNCAVTEMDPGRPVGAAE